MCLAAMTIVAERHVIRLCRASKGVAMRRSSAVLLIIVALMLVIGAAGCGEASKASLAGDDQSPQAILAAAVAASETMTGAAGTFDVTLSFDADTSQMPEEAKAFLEEPIAVSGTFGYADEPRAGDFTVALSMAGESMDVGVKLIENKFWLSMLDQWYEAPAEMEQMMGQSFDQQTQLDEMKALLDELGVDPVTWFKDLRLVGKETLDGADVYHLSGSPDMAKMMTDVLGLMESEEFMGLVDPSGSITGSLGMGELMPSADELQEMQTQLTEMFKEFTIDLWVGTDDSMLRKAAIDLKLMPPAGEETDGFNGIAMQASVSLDGGDTVKVEPPASALPFSDLEKSMQENPELFFGSLMGLFGGMNDFGTTETSTYSF
jgi:hypothetical protein